MRAAAVRLLALQLQCSSDAAALLDEPCLRNVERLVAGARDAGCCIAALRFYATALQCLPEPVALRAVYRQDVLDACLDGHGHPHEACAFVVALAARKPELFNRYFRRKPRLCEAL